MKKFLSIVLAASLCIPAVAQKTGMTNNDAQTVKQSIMAGEAKISLDYTASTWAGGQWHSRLTDKENGAKARGRFNEMAANAPLGSMTTSVDLKIGDVTVPAGEYAVYFTMNDDLSWSMNLKGKDKVHSLKLALMENPGHEHKRLVLSLYAGDDSNTAGVYIGFGKNGGMLTLAPNGKGGAKEASGGK